MSQVTIQILAKQLGLSIATVSKALRDSHEISNATKKEVAALAKQLNYVPNPYASSLRRKRSNTIAVVIPEVADSFFSLAIRGIEEIAQSKGYHILVYLTNERFEDEVKILDDCRSGRVDGILISAASETDSFQHVENLLADKIPVVFFDRAPKEIAVSKVVTDDFESAYKATLHLADAGCHNIMYLSISGNMDMNNQRISGFIQGLRQRDLYLSDGCIVNCTNDAAANRKIIDGLLLQTNRPDGLLISVEKLIIPVYASCKTHHIAVPGQLKLIGFSTTEYAGILSPTLSTVEQPATEMGRRAATALFEALRKKDFTANRVQAVVPSVLQVRESSTNIK
jgi:LacI family transcriptional regulator